MPPLARMSANSFSICSFSQSKPRSRMTNFRRALFLFCAVAVLVEDADHGFDFVEQALFGNELVEQLGFDRQRSQTAADDHAEAALAVADHGAQADVVDGALNAVLIGRSRRKRS